MSYSALSEVACFPFNSLACNFVSSIGLQERDSNRRLDVACSSFVSGLQDQFLLGTEISDDSNFYPMLQRGVFRRSRARSHRKCFCRRAPRPPSFSSSSSTHSPVLCYAMVGLPAFILRSFTYFRKSMNSSVAVSYTLDRNNLVSMRIFKGGIYYDMSSVYYCCNGILLNLSS